MTRIATINFNPRAPGNTGGSGDLLPRERGEEANMPRNYYSADFQVICPQCGVVDDLEITAQSGDALTPGHPQDIAPHCIYQCVDCGADLEAGQRTELRTMPCH